MIANPCAILPFSPSHSAAAFSALWNRMRQRSTGSAESVAKLAPYFSSSLQVFMYSACIRLASAILPISDAVSPFAPTNPSNMLRAARTSTHFSPQAQPISSFAIPFGSARPRLTSESLMCPS